MRHSVRVGVFATAILATALAGCGRAPLPTAGGKGMSAAAALAKGAVRPGELIVKLKPGAARQALLQKLGARTLSRIAPVDALVLKVANAAEALATLKADPSVAWAEPNYVAKAFDLPSAAPRLAFGPRSGDDLLGKLWGMSKIGAEQAWSASTGKGAKVAVVDTGIDYNHPDLKDRVVDKGKDFASGNPDAFDDHYHGTHCAGTVAATRGNGGVVGVAPDAALVAVKVLGADGSGSYAGVAAGICYAADSGAQIVSMSLGGPSTSAALDDAVKYAIGKGALVVAAMGNNGSMDPSYPAACPGVLAVGATNSDDHLPNFTNCGNHISVVAPGVEILSTIPGGQYEELAGTSMATPHVAGLAALLKAKNPGWNAKQIRERIQATADDKGIAGFDPYFGNGRIHAGKALN